jgi:hypothetical protein
MEVSLVPSQTEQLQVNRTITAKGANRFPHMRMALTTYDYLYDSKADKYSISLLEKQQTNKKAKAETERKISSKKEQDIKDRQDRIKTELESELGAKVLAYNHFNLLETGIWSDKPEIKYQDEFIMEGLLTNNGQNLMLSAGKLIGQQIELEKNELTRKEDVYMPYARSFSYTITIHVPEGYEVKGLEKFNVNVANATGGFVSSARQEGSKIVVTTNKYYNHNFEKAADWPSMVAFLEASYDFTQQKLLFKKIRI